jgi:cytochrome c peroxidase
MFGSEPVELCLKSLEGELLARLCAEPMYPPLFKAAFPDEADPIVIANVVKARESMALTERGGDHGGRLPLVRSVIRARMAALWRMF